MDVDGMLDRMTVQQLDEWDEYDKLQPLDHQTDMLGLMAWMLSNYFAREKLAPDPYMPWVKKESKRAGTGAGKAYLKQRGMKLKERNA